MLPMSVKSFFSNCLTKVETYLKGLDQPYVPLVISNDDTVPEEAETKTAESFVDDDTALRFNLCTAENGWEVGVLSHEIKIDTQGLVYFKINNKWILQPTINSLKFYRE